MKNNIKTLKECRSDSDIQYWIEDFEAELREPLTKERQNEILGQCFSPTAPITQVYQMASVVVGFWQGYKFARKEILGDSENVAEKLHEISEKVSIDSDILAKAEKFAKEHGHIDVNRRFTI